MYIEQNRHLKIEKIRDFFKIEHFMFALIFIGFISAGVYRAELIGPPLKSFVNRFLENHTYDSPAGPYLFLSEYLSQSDVVMVNRYEGWVIPAMTGARVVAPQKSNPLINDEVSQRIEEVKIFFCGRISLKERQKIIAKYRITHIMINLIDRRYWDKPFIDNLGEIGREVARERTHILYKVTATP